MHRKTVWLHFFKKNTNTFLIPILLVPLPSVPRINGNTNITIESETLPKYSIKEKNLSRVPLYNDQELNI